MKKNERKTTRQTNAVVKAGIILIPTIIPVVKKGVKICLNFKRFSKKLSRGTNILGRTASGHQFARNLKQWSRFPHNFKKVSKTYNLIEIFYS
ncbi:MAG: hypothetical protein COX19_15310 [Desulfobacterales bacterium CG23_combo_of_CG06-09_8_20_14_all_51_8]|nr:MAG: hypothetical protein COX19_15310 [Desulfobacterales bacterium CG23_combo_of_CG06-09_8_20_14_all_51_8]